MDYYLGHSDSCTGDSGGPLWQFIGKHSFKIRYYFKFQAQPDMNLKTTYLSIYKHPRVNAFSDKIGDEV